MNVERIQKINNLALDLMRQGLAKDREEAIAEAEKIFTSQDTTDYENVNKTMPELKEDQQPAEVEKDLSQEDIKEILEKNTSFLVNKIKAFEEKVASMEKEIGHLRTKLTFQRLPTAEQVRPEKKEEVTSPPVEQTQQTIPQQTNTSPPAAQTQQAAPDHPRSGNYKEDDVAIEKFFYMGKK